ncbi:hypothetical protein GCM10027022_08770 [Alpinimonas psychrophila]
MVNDLMPGSTQVRLQKLAEFESGMVGGEVNAHFPILGADRLVRGAQPFTPLDCFARHTCWKE